MAACCCVNNGEGIETWDLPIEPEQDAPVRMSQLKRTDYGADEVKDRPVNEEVKVGAVMIPESASQGLELLHCAAENLVIIVTVLEDGPWARWNATHPDHMVCPGDQVVEVNNKRDDYSVIVAELTLKTTKSRVMSMSIVRPVENIVKLAKEDGKAIGLVLAPLESGLLFVDGVKAGGLIAEWNSERPRRRVRLLDQIVEVNGIRGSASDLVEAMKQEGGTVRLTLMTHPG